MKEAGRVGVIEMRPRGSVYEVRMTLQVFIAKAAIVRGSSSVASMMDSRCERVNWVWSQVSPSTQGLRAAVLAPKILRVMQGLRQPFDVEKWRSGEVSK